MAKVGTSDNPLRVAIVGAGPAGFYTLGGLLGQAGLHVATDMFDRLPAPFGLVRYGVAPDHPKDRSVTKTYDRFARQGDFRFYGNVEYGRDIGLRDLQDHYHQVVFTTGAQTDRTLGIPGEALQGCHSAAAFVGWYNGHPDFSDARFDLGQESAVVVGMGNVALDVARMLCRPLAELEQTDIAEHALEALRASRIKRVYLLGRRGPAQAAFTPREIRELGALCDTQVSVPRDEASLDALSAQAVLARPDGNVAKNLAIIEQFSRATPRAAHRQLTLRFLVSPTALVGRGGRLSALRLTRNELRAAEDGNLQVRATGSEETLPAGLMFRAIGYRGVRLPDLPFDEAHGTIENDKGRIAAAGLYAAGWIKRGASGVIGTNKTCARETVACMIEDLAHERILRPRCAAPEAVERLVRSRCDGAISYPEWLVLDELERRRGQAVQRPRVRFTSTRAMLAALGR